MVFGNPLSNLMKRFSFEAAASRLATHPDETDEEQKAVK